MTVQTAVHRPAPARLVAPLFPSLPDLAITDELTSAIQDGAWIVFNLSGGKDSGAAIFAVNLYLDLLGHPRERRMAIHADLGRAEWASTTHTIQRIVAAGGTPLTVVRRAAGDLVDRWIQRFESGKRRYEALETYHLIGPWSSASLRFCQSEMKAAVIGPAVARMLPGEHIISVLGLRRDESHNRAAIPIVRPDYRHAKAGNRQGTTMSLWNPLVDWTAADVFRAHDLLGIPLHEAYTDWGSSRLSCRYCIFASLQDLQASSAAPANGDVYRELVGIEARSTFPFQPTRWLADVAPYLLSPSHRAVTRPRTVLRVGALTISGRTLSKIRLGEQGYAGAIDQLVSLGLPRPATHEDPAQWLWRLEHDRLLLRHRQAGLYA
ncbi:MAG TPA: phosphoadenosine phosphosulfate reductase family protein [Sphingobium sp.]|uniref:phosphoadenosine phosphosulfate reductase domain-containing protein n=1 Tax=Sphingobium sp. TaxID=1912891 RepID=UPI002ED3C4BE